MILEMPALKLRRWTPADAAGAVSVPAARARGRAVPATKRVQRVRRVMCPPRVRARASARGTANATPGSAEVKHLRGCIDRQPRRYRGSPVT